MKKKILLSASIALFASTALAGLYQQAPLILDLDGQFAQGDMVTVSGSKDTTALIGCGTRRVSIPQAGVDFRFGFCQAADDLGNQVTCFTEDPALLDEMRASNDSSFVTFSWDWDAEPGGACTLRRVGFSTQSFYLSKQK